MRLQYIYFCSEPSASYRKTENSQQLVTMSDSSNFLSHIVALSLPSSIPRSDWFST
ncbi:hypothetical protein GBA52_000973 [Prunus armeniaca]|nr:hypothetical protein GBA52_000973 [Prunus armeniaca]